MKCKPFKLIISFLILVLVATFEIRAESPVITMIFYTDPGNPFWPKVIAGADEAAKSFGIKMDYQFAKNDPVQQNNAIETAVANGVAGIAVAINDDQAYDESIASAMAHGVPVVAFNIDDSKGAEGNKRLAYVGQDLERAGYVLGKRLVTMARLKKGDHVVCPVEIPEATYARLRFKGVKRALDEAGCSSEMLNTGAIGMEDNLNKLTQYLLGHPETKMVIGLGGMPTEVAPQAIADANLKIPNAGFDITKTIIQNIIDDKTLMTIDQQPFYQGFMTITLLHYYKKYGLPPMDITTGLEIIDKSNAKLALEFAGKTR